MLLLLDWQHRPWVGSPLEVDRGCCSIVLAVGCLHHLRLLDLVENRPHVGVLIEDSLQLLWLILIHLQRAQRPLDQRVLFSNSRAVLGLLLESRRPSCASHGTEVV